MKSKKTHMPEVYGIKGGIDMKKWNIINLLINDQSTPPYDYSITYTDEDNNTTELISGADFCNLILQKYWSFWIMTPSYYDTVQNRYIEFCDNITDAIGFLHMTFENWASDRVEGFMKLYEALRGEYNPIENYNKNIESTMEYKGKETNTETPTGTETDTFTPSGTETDTLTKSGSEKNTETPSGTETDTLTKTGSTTNTHNSGSNGVGHVTTLSKTPYDSAGFLDAEKTVESPYTDNDVESFTDRTDTNTKSFTGRKTEDELTFTNRQDTNVKTFTNRQNQTVRSFTNRKTEHEKSFTNRIDEYKYHEWGNIGVTTSQQMIMSQFPLTEKDKLKDYIVNLFVHENLVL